VDAHAWSSEFWSAYRSRTVVRTSLKDADAANRSHIVSTRVLRPQDGAVFWAAFVNSERFMVFGLNVDKHGRDHRAQHQRCAVIFEALLGACIVWNLTNGG